MGRRVVSIAGAVLLAALLGACIPPPEDPPPSWRATVQTWGSDSDGPFERPFTATTEDWWAVIEVPPDFSTATLLLFARTGPGGSPAAVPAHRFELQDGATDLAMDDHVVAVTPRRAVEGQLRVSLFELDGGAWSPAGVLARPLDDQRHVIVDVTDSHLVLGERGRNDLPQVDGQVVVQPIDRAGPGISWSTGDAQTLSPDPSWQVAARNGFGAQLSIEDDLLAVGTDEDRIAVHELAGGTWTLDQVLVTSYPGSDATFGRSIALDASGGARMAVGSSGGWIFGVPQPGRLEVFERGATGWALSQTIGPREGSALGGFGLGTTVALDGDRLVQSAHWAVVPRPGGDGTIADLRVEVHDLAATPTFRAELSTLDALGGVAALPNVSMIGTVELDLAGDHLAVNGIGSFGLDPTHYSAISFDLR
jgi:hypothetical protein